MSGINWRKPWIKFFILSSLVAALSALLRFTKPTSLLSVPLATIFTRNLSAPVTTPLASEIMSTMQFIPRRSEERGHADHNWLKTFHTFSFAGYQDHKHMSFGSLRVINEDRVAPRTGFGTHSHREFEIFSYVVSGELEHQDSMGNVEVIGRGDIQMTSAGTGISHSEKAHGSTQVHFLQIWAVPNQSRLKPKYFNRHFSDEEKKDQWARIVAPVGAEGVLADAREGTGPAPVNSDLTMYATILSASKKLERPLQGPKGYIHVIQTGGYNPGQSKGAKVKITTSSWETLELGEGDGAYIQVGKAGNSFTIENVGDKSAEVIVFDLN